MLKQEMLRAIAVLVAGSALSLAGVAETVTWVNPAGGEWTEGSNWDTGNSPTEDDDVILPALAGPYTVIVTGTVNANTVDISGSDVTVWVQGSLASGQATLSVIGDVNNAGTLRLEAIETSRNCTVTSNNGTLTNSGSILIGTGTLGNRDIDTSITNTGTITVEPGIGLRADKSGAVFNMLSGTLTTADDFLIEDGAFVHTGGTITGDVVCRRVDLTLGPAGTSTFFLEGASTLNSDIPTGRTVWIRGNGTASTATLTLATDVVNNGTIRLESIDGGLNASLLTQVFTLTNAGTIIVAAGSGGTREIDGNVTNTGSISVDPLVGITFDNDNAIFRMTDGTFETGNVVSFNDGAFEHLGGTINGDLRLARVDLTLGPAGSSTFFMEGISTLNSDIPAGQTVWVRGSALGGQASMDVPNGITNNGTLRLEAVDANRDCTVNVLSGAVENIGSIFVGLGTGGDREIDGSVVNSGSTFVAPGAELTLDNDNATFTMQSGTFTTNDAVTVTDGAFVHAGGTIVGDIRCARVALTLGPAGSSTFFMEGNSTLNSDIPAGQTVSVRGSSSSGNANLSLTADVTNNGALRLESIDLSRTSNLLIGENTLENNGTITVALGTGGNREIDGSVTNSGEFTIEPGASLIVDNDGATFDMAAGTLNTNDALTVTDGAFSYTDGIINGVATLRGVSLTLLSTAAVEFIIEATSELNSDVAADQTLRLLGSTAGGNVNLTATSGVAVNNGMIILDSPDTSRTISLGAVDGALLNNGTIEFREGGGGTRRFTGNLTNEGTLRFESGVAHDLNGQLLCNPSSLVEIEIGGFGPTMTTLLDVEGAAVLEGELNVTNVNGFSPLLTERFQIIDAFSIPTTRAFTSITGDGPYGITYDFAGGTATLTLVDGPCPTFILGDLNGDNVVGASDLNILLTAFGAACE